MCEWPKHTLPAAMESGAACFRVEQLKRWRTLESPWDTLPFWGSMGPGWPVAVWRATVAGLENAWITDVAELAEEEGFEPPSELPR
jgi:hypothetical protein